VVLNFQAGGDRSMQLSKGSCGTGQLKNEFARCHDLHAFASTPSKLNMTMVNSGATLAYLLRNGGACGRRMGLSSWFFSRVLRQPYVNLGPCAVASLLPFCSLESCFPL
jgi:hypothetical protein